MINNNRFSVIMILVSLLLSFLLLRECKSKSDLGKELNLQKKAMSDTTKLHRNEKNQLVAEKLVFVGDKKAALQEVERWKTLGLSVQSKLDKTMKQLTIVNRKLEVSGSGKVKPPKDSIITIFNVIIDTPSLSIDTGDAFHHLKFASNKNKYAYQITVADSMEFKIDDKGRKGTLVTVLNKNPYIVSSDVKSVLISNKKQSSFLKYLSFMAGFGVAYLILK
jgi:hypothetical protein